MRSVFFGFALAAAALSGFSQTPVIHAADEHWSELIELGLLKRDYPENYERMSQREKILWRERQNMQLRAKGLAFIDAHPGDPRRWRVVLGLMRNQPGFIKGFGPDIEVNFNDVIKDEAAAADWREKLATLKAALRASLDVPVDVAEELAVRDLKDEVGSLIIAGRNSRHADWAPVLAKLREFSRAYPDSANPVDVVRYGLKAFAAVHSPGETAEAWRPFAAGPNKQLAAFAMEQLRFFDLAHVPLDLAFTAVDGRRVDLRDFRGKVVLIDFWATWCGPCIEELPNVKRVYEAYRERGFEVIGVSLDFAKDRQKLLDFVAKENMPWPQHFEGRSLKGGANSLAARFSITGIPAMLLLDKEGVVVSTNARGPVLEREVARLLGQ